MAIKGMCLKCAMFVGDFESKHTHICNKCNLIRGETMFQADSSLKMVGPSGCISNSSLSNT